MRLSHVQAPPAWHTHSRTAAHHRTTRKRKFYAGPILILLLIAIESLLLGRLAGQATSQDPNSFWFGRLLMVTDLLVAPFRDLRPEYTFKETGIVEFSTLLALEGYLVVGLTLIFLIQVVHISAWFVRRGRNARARAGLAAAPVPLAEAPAATSTAPTSTQQATADQRAA